MFLNVKGKVLFQTHVIGPVSLPVVQDSVHYGGPGVTDRYRC